MVVWPSEIPLTTPVALTDPTKVLLLLQTPPAVPVASLSAVVDVAQTLDAPVIVPPTAVLAITVTIVVA